jgi:hypothetical protein
MIITGALSFAGLLLMLVCFLVVAAIVYFVTTFDIEALAVLLLGGGLFLLLMCVGYFLMGKQAQPSVHTEEVAEELDEPVQVTAQQVSRQLTHEELWDQLTRPRIPLDGEAEPRPEAAAEDLPEAPPARPSWVGKSPKRVGNVYRVAVSSDRYRDVQECHLALEPKMLEVVNARIGQLTLTGQQPRLQDLGLGLEFVFRKICHEDEWVETVEASFGEMKIVHVLMEFDAAIDKQLRTAVRDFQREARVAHVGGIAGLSLGGLALLFGLLKMDTWTRGYYTKRLFLGVPAAIIGVILLFVTS